MGAIRQIGRRSLVLACIFVGVGALTATAIGSLSEHELAAAREAASKPLPASDARHSLAIALRDPSARVKAKADFERLRRQAQREFRARMPKPNLPAGQRGPWVAAWNEMRACARRHGFEGVSEVEPTYGDGETAMPNIDLDQPNAQAALKACPFEVRGRM